MRASFDSNLCYKFIFYTDDKRNFLILTIYNDESHMPLLEETKNVF